MAEPRTNWPPRSPRSRKPSTIKAVLPLVALIDRDGTVTALFRRPDEVRAFLQGGHA